MIEMDPDVMAWEAGFDEALDRMAYWLDKEGCKPDTIKRLRGLIETEPVPETPLIQEKPGRGNGS